MDPLQTSIEYLKALAHRAMLLEKRGFKISRPFTFFSQPLY